MGGRHRKVRHQAAPAREARHPSLAAGARVTARGGGIVIGLVGSVEWSQVGAALGRLSWTAIPLLIALLFVRQGFNAVPLSRFVAGLGWWRSVQNDVTANLIGTVAPPPGDVVIRVSMFRSWGSTRSTAWPG